MIIKHVPSYPLNQFIHSYIYYSGYTGSASHAHILPDAQARLVIEFDENVRSSLDETDQAKQSFKETWVAGIQSRPMTYEADKSNTTVSIQFKAGGLFALFGIPAVEFQDKIYEATSIDSSVGQLRELLLAECCSERIFKLITTFLHKKIFLEYKPIKLLSLLPSLKFDQRVDNISQLVGYSKKHLIHLFKQEVGMTPKKYLRLLRFNTALHYLQEEEGDSFLDLVSYCQFYDQAHFIHEFRYFTNYTPHQYLQLNRDTSHIIPLN